MARGAGQVLLGHDGVEDAEQVQVKRKKAHGDPFGQAYRQCLSVYPIYRISIHEQYKQYLGT
jgi:hypothetical protein